MTIVWCIIGSLGFLILYTFALKWIFDEDKRMYNKYIEMIEKRK
jgi:hypothetical protein